METAKKRILNPLLGDFVFKILYYSVLLSSSVVNRNILTPRNRIPHCAWTHIFPFFSRPFRHIPSTLSLRSLSLARSYTSGMWFLSRCVTFQISWTFFPILVKHYASGKNFPFFLSLALFDQKYCTVCAKGDFHSLQFHRPFSNLRVLWGRESEREV